MKLLHLTPKNLGDMINLKPFVSSERHGAEIETPRVSAAPSINECIVALYQTEWFEATKKENKLCLFVYEVIDESNFSEYDSVFDFDKTSESISFIEVPAKLVGIIHIPYSNNANYLRDKICVTEANCVYEHITETVYNKYYK